LLIIESFDTAVQDLSRALELKVSLYKTSNPIVSEAHYKLSLALEFAQNPSPEQNKSLSLQHLESAIASVKERVKILESEGNSAEAADAREMIDELTIKVNEMKNPQKPNIDVSSMFGSAANINEALQQKLAASLGAANDLTGLVRRKEKPQIASEAGNVAVIAGEKRKIEGNIVVGSPGKKVRVEDVDDED
jgi:HAT1-interacting factor 1